MASATYLYGKIFKNIAYHESVTYGKFVKEYYHGRYHYKKIPDSTYLYEFYAGAAVIVLCQLGFWALFYCNVVLVHVENVEKE